MSAAENKAVFLSYASEDADAARKIADALRGAGVEVWFDQSELRGGDAWDAKIRKQIKECALFVPVISANTQARLEGYFRLEWKLAAQRTHTMADAKPFLVPVCIDATRDAEAHVPEEFRAVQWTHLRQAYGGQARDDASVAAFCARLAALLEHSAGSPSTGSGQALPAGELPKSGQAGGATIEARRPRPVRRIPVAAWAGALLACAVVLFLVRTWWLRKEGATFPAASLSMTEGKSVAVLPFLNRSGDPEQEYFSDGLTEEILGALRRERDLTVPGNTSCFAFKGNKTVTAPEIARALNVTRLVEGSVQRDGTRVRIRVTLSRPADNSSEELGTFTEELTDVFALQDKIARAVVAKLAHRATATTPAGAQTQNLAAFDLYLRGRALQTAPQSTSAQFEIIKLYEEAVRLDPNYALAWARLSEIYAGIITGGYDRIPQHALKASQAAATALRLAPQLPEAYAAIANVRLNIDRDHDAAQRALDELARLAPNSAELFLARANLERARGNWAESLVQFVARAAELDPQNAAALNRLASLLTVTSRFAETDRLSRRSWELSPTASNAIRRRASNHVAWTGDVDRALEIYNSAPVTMQTGVLFHQARANLHLMRGDVAAAIADLERMKLAVRDLNMTASGPRIADANASQRLAQLEASRGRAAPAAAHLEEALRLARRYVSEFPELEAGPACLARIHAARGEKAEALAALGDAMAITLRTRDALQIANMRGTKAEVLAILGDKAAAIAELRAIHDMGYGFGFMLRLEPEWAPLRSEPGFQQLMAEAEARAKAQPPPAK